MSEVCEQALVAGEGQLSSANSTPARRLETTATKLDSLLVLTAAVAFAFGWAPILDSPEIGVAITVTVSLLWLVLEHFVPFKEFRGTSDGWLRAFTKGDALILLFALLSSVLLFLPLLVAVIIWAFVTWRARRHDQPSGADEWFHRSAILTSFVAIMVAAEAAKAWLYGMPAGVYSPLFHEGFHQFLDGAIGVSCALLFLLHAWTSLRTGQGSAVATLVLGGFPTAALAGWAAAVALINQRDYGSLHTYAWLLVVFWVLGIFCAVRGLTSQRRAASQDGPLAANRNRPSVAATVQNASRRTVTVMLTRPACR